MLSLALEETDAAVVLDDLAARKFAITFQIPLLGTLGILLRAKRAGLIGSLRPDLQALDEAGANLSQTVIDHALKLADE